MRPATTPFPACFLPSPQLCTASLPHSVVDPLERTLSPKSARVRGAFLSLTQSLATAGARWGGGWRDLHRRLRALLWAELSC